MSISERKAGVSSEGRRRLRLLCISLTIALIAPPLKAAVERIEILERAPFAQGAPFGAVGPYERIRGRCISRSIRTIRPTPRSST